MDDLSYLLFAILFGLYMLVGPGLGIAAFQRGRGITRELTRLRREVERLAGELEAAKRDLGPRGEEPAAAASPSASIEAAASEPSPAEAMTAEAVYGPPAAARAPGPDWFDRLLTSLKHNWVVWLAALTVALGGAFLVKYSIDRGWLGPLVRVLLGGLLGLALLLAGEKLRRQPLAFASDQLPVGLSVAGVFLLYASSYAAYALFGLVGPLTAFLLLAGIALGSVVLSLIQGRLLAHLGLLGGFTVPALVTTAEPRAATFFAYLAAVTLAALPLLGARGWWSLGWVALAGSATWTLLWFAASWQPADPLSPALHVLVVSAAFLLARGGQPSFALAGWARGLRRLSSGERLAWGAGFYGALLVFALVRMDAYDTISLTALFLLTALLLFAARREDALDGLALIAALPPLALLATWHLPQLLAPDVLRRPADGPALGLLPTVPPEFAAFVLVCGLFALLFGLGGFLLQGGTRRPWLWAGLSAAMPPLLLAVAYWQLKDFAVDLGWSGMALALAALACGAAGLVARQERIGGNDLSLAAYGAAAAAAIALGAAMALREAWLTVALAFELPVLGWLALRLKLPPLRPVAFLVAAVVLQRLLANPAILDYGGEGLAGLAWILYGYGLPAAAFALAAQQFRRQREDSLVLVLEAGTLIFLSLLATFAIRQISAGSLAAASFGLAERSLDALAWLAIALACHLLASRRPSPVLRWGWRLLLAMGGGLVLLNLALLNPVSTGEQVGPWPLVNLLALAYLAPALLALLFAWRFAGEGAPRLAAAAALSALLLGFAWITFETRHGFTGTQLDGPPVQERELYGYSLVWLSYALALLGLSYLRRSALLRRAAFAALLPAVLKVYLVDMGELTGLLRAASFLALGLSLFGIAYLNRKLGALKSGRSAAPKEG